MPTKPVRWSRVDLAMLAVLLFLFVLAVFA